MKKKIKVETTTLNAVPPEEQKGWLSVAFIQAGVYICVPALMLGGMLVSSMPLRDAIIAGTLGYIISGIIMSLIGIIGADMHVPTTIIAKSSFGQSGTRIVMSLVIALSSFGWFAIQNVVCGEAFSNLLEATIGVQVPVMVSTVIWGLIMLSTAVLGIDGLKTLNDVSVPLLFIVFVVGMIMALNKFGTAGMSAPPEGEPMSIVDGTVMTLSFLACGMTIAPDLTRYQKSRGGVCASSFVGLCPAGIALLIIGAILTKITGQYDISYVLMDAGIPALGLIVLILATWTTNTTNAYSGGIALVMFFNLPDNKRAQATMISGGVGIVLALMGITNHLGSFIDFLGICYFPVAGVLLADYWIIRKGNPGNWGFCKTINYSGFIAWVAGVLLTLYAPFGLFIGFISSMVIYIVCYRILPNPVEITNLNGDYVQQ